jgi:hypothetical protein
MKRSIARWTTTMAAAALIAVPTAGYAQGSAQPPTQTPPAQTPPAQTTPAPQSSQPAPDQDAAKQHLTAARNSLSEMTQLPAASQLTGEARTQVSQLISNFNELITTNSDWRASYAKLETNLNALLGPQSTDEAAARASGTEGAVGTSGTVTLDPAIKSKLIEFRNHLAKFEEAAGGAKASSAAPSSVSSAAPPSAPASAAASSAPPSATNPATPSEPMAPQSSTAGQPSQEDVLRHIAAIEAILGIQSATGTAGTTGTSGSTAGAGAASTGNVTLTASQIEQLRTHLSELRRLVQK